MHFIQCKHNLYLYQLYDIFPPNGWSVLCQSNQFEEGKSLKLKGIASLWLMKFKQLWEVDK